MERQIIALCEAHEDHVRELQDVPIAISFFVGNRRWELHGFGGHSRQNRGDRYQQRRNEYLRAKEWRT